MPFLGLMDWIVISLFALIIFYGLVCFMLMKLWELFAFQPAYSYLPTTFFTNKTGEQRSIGAPTIYYKHVAEREEKLRWYHRLIVGP